MASENAEALSAEDLKFDEARFRTANADIAILQWLSTAEKAIDILDAEQLQPSVTPLHEAFQRILVFVPSGSNKDQASATGLPKPGRPIRALVSRCLVKLHLKVEDRSLFDFVQGLMRTVMENNGQVLKHGQDLVYKVATWYCIGEVMKAFGANMMSFMSDIGVTVIRLIRATSQPVLLRSHGIVAFTKSLHTAGKAVPDQMIKDLSKNLKNGLTDAACAVQRNSAEAIIALQRCSSFVTSISDIEAINHLALRSLEKADHSTRRPLSKLVAYLLAVTQEATPFPADNKGKKSTNAEADADANDSITIVKAAADTSPKTLLKPEGMLKLLAAHLNKANTPRRTRNAIFDVYATLFADLGPNWVESNYATIMDHLFTQIVDHPRSNSSRYEILAVREAVGILLRDVIAIRSLSEQGQSTAIEELSNTWLKKWPALLPGQKAPTEAVLVVALKEVAGLLQQLGTASPAIDENLQEPLTRLLTHPMTSVRLHAAWTLRIYCTTTPLRLPKMLSVLVDALDKDIALINDPTAPKDLSARAIGRAQGIAALVAVIRDRPLYVSHDISSRLMDTAAQILKRSGEHDVTAANIEIQVAWTLITALMTLNKAFVKSHLPSLLVLWRNALPKPTSKDSSVGERGESEWAYLLQVRECTLSSILAFLRSNRELATLDVARRITSLLTNTLNFVNGFATAYAEYLRELQQQNPNNTAIGSTSQTANLAEKECLLRRRVLQCFTLLADSSATESVQPALVQAAVGVLADPDSIAIGSTATQTAIQASAGGFTDVWQAADGFGFGVSSYHAGDEKNVTSRGYPNYLNRDDLEVAIESQMSRPILSALENDGTSICGPRSQSLTTEISVPEVVAPTTGVVNAGLDLLAALLHQQTIDVTLQAVTLMTNHLRSPNLERNPWRREAVLFNIMLALQMSLKQAVAVGGRRAKETLGSPNVVGVIRGLLQEGILDKEHHNRDAASLAMGYLAIVAGGAYSTSQVQWLVDQVVTNRTPEGRAGTACGLSAIFSNLGGMTAGSMLKTVYSILSSLVLDPHPIVHFYALKSLTEIVDAASLSYSPFVEQTLALSVTVYLADTHEPEGGSLGSSNMRGDLPAYQLVCRLVGAIIGVLGPDLQEESRSQKMCMLLVHEFSEEEDEGMAVEAIRAVQQLLMFAPNQVDIPSLVKLFRSHIISRRVTLRIAAITALYQIVQRDAPLMSKLGGNRLVEDLFSLLDEDPNIDGVREIILSWIQQTSAASPSSWINLCQRIISQSAVSAKTVNKSSNVGFQDDEGQSLDVSSGSAITTGSSARWRTQLFALQCVHEIINSVASSGRPENFDAVLARQHGIRSEALLISKVPDLIRLAFSASTATTSEVRLQGLIVLKDVVERFAKSPDPDFDGSFLLEQHQAPIAAALTPSFGSDSSPEVLAAAIQVCAIFVGSGAVQEVSRMGRILRMLTNALARCEDTSSASLGEVEDLSSNASAMVKISALSAWAELRIASASQQFLVAVVQPHKATLNKLWVGALKDYALMRVDGDGSSASSNIGSLDLSQSGLGKEVLLPHFERAAMHLLEALGLAMSDNEESVLLALQGSPPGTVEPVTDDLIVRTKPLPNFFALYGLAFEAVSKSLGEAAAQSRAAASLRAMQSLVRIEYCGTAMFTSSIFDELCTLSYRIAATESATVRSEMVKVMAAFANSRGLFSNQDTIRRTLAIVAYALRSAIGSKDAATSFLPRDSNEDRVKFFNAAFAAYGTIVRSLEPNEGYESLMVALFLFTGLLKEEQPTDVIGGILGTFKGLLDQAGHLASDVWGFGKLVHSVLSSVLNNIDDMRGRQGAQAVLKIKNNMLTAVLVITTLPATVPVSLELVEQICYTVGRATSEMNGLAVVAAQCCKALMVSAVKGQVALQQGLNQLIPELVKCLGNIARDADTVKAGDAKYTTAEEVIRILLVLVESTDETDKTQVYMVLLPTMGLLLDPENPTPVHTLAINHLLKLATQSPNSFKEATSSLTDAAKEKLETSIRQAVASRQNNSKTTTAKPQISLKSFG